MIDLRSFRRDISGSSAAEFALVLPLLLLLLLGSIDVGRWMWNVGQMEKATMMGTRYAVVTDMVPSGLASYKFSLAGVPQGSLVPQSDFPGVACTSSGGTVSCVCNTAQGSCAFPLTADQTAFNRIVDRMSGLYSGIGPDNVRIEYDYSGLGYSGNPNGPDVDPIVTVSLQNMNFRPITFATLGAIGLPGTSHSLTMEDGTGVTGN